MKANTYKILNGYMLYLSTTEAYLTSVALD